MEIKTGYLYHIKDKFFDIVKEESLMQNHERGKKRPTYFTIKDKDILWFIPISSKVEKYQKIIDIKIKKYGYCNTILIETFANKKQVILIQNAFPTLEKYIDHIHTYRGVPVKIKEPLQNKILSNFNRLLHLKKKGINLFFTDIDKIKKMMEKEFEIDRGND